MQLPGPLTTAGEEEPAGSAGGRVRAPPSERPSASGGPAARPGLRTPRREQLLPCNVRDPAPSRSLGPENPAGCGGGKSVPGKAEGTFGDTERARGRRRATARRHEWGEGAPRRERKGGSERRAGDSGDAEEPVQAKGVGQMARVRAGAADGAPGEGLKAGFRPYLKSLSLDVIFSSRLEMWYEALAMLTASIPPAGAAAADAAAARRRRRRCSSRSLAAVSLPGSQRDADAD